MGALLLLAPKGDAEAPRSSGLSRRRFWLAAAVAVLAALTSANGFLVAPVGAWLLLRRPRWMMPAWGAVFVPPLAIYLYQYHLHLPTAPVAWWTKPVFFLAVLGGAAPDRALAIWGLILMAVWGWSFVSGYHRRNPYAAAVSIWVVATGALIAAGRGSFGVGFAHSSRYKLYADLLMVFCFVFGFSRVRARVASARGRRMGYAGALALTLLLYLHGEVQAFRILSDREADLRTGLANYRANPVELADVSAQRRAVPGSGE